MGSPTLDRPPAALLGIKLATGDVHLMQGGLHPLRHHAGTVGVHVEATFAADDGLVHTTFVALALVVGLRGAKVKVVQQMLQWKCLSFG